MRGSYEIYNELDYSLPIKLSVGEFDYDLPRKVEFGIKSFLMKNDFSKNCLSYPSDHSDFSQKLVHQIKILISFIHQLKILLTAGSTESLRIIFDTFLNESKSVFFPIPSYSNALNLIKTKTLEIRREVCLNYQDIKDYLLQDSYSLVYLSSPNNPLGYILSDNQIRELSVSFPQTIFVIDSCYLEYDESFSNFNLFDCENVVIVRTFSKAFGLAGLRIGYMYSNFETIQKLKNFRDPHLPTELAKYSALLALKI
ncbi:MAG: aminotransferase class I/II-fold pyridoxal phosphate-dependent enzyme [Richelia sp. SM1_7_0]|nr:aminotransferase class I/II-fold pyridoxal phosphate-dependent enzyme [Richelia sp. SM1_7_0]